MQTDEQQLPNDWITEAEGIIKDVKMHLKDVHISTVAKTTQYEVFLNVTTLEDREICIRVSTLGFGIVGQKYDQTDGVALESPEIYETPYALFSCISPKYIESFGNSLVSALNQLKDE